MSDVWAEFKAPFRDDEIEWRTSRCGVKDGKKWAVIVPYITSRAIMNRLDEVMGPDKWQDEYRPIDSMSEKGVVCRLGIMYGDTWVWKEDGAEFSSNFSEIKGGISDAIKRAAVKFGMGRYLYDIDEVTVFNDQIKDGYPPKGIDHVMIVSDKANIHAWTAAPKLSEIMAGIKPVNPNYVKVKPGGTFPNEKNAMNPIAEKLTDLRTRFSKVKESGMFTQAELKKMNDEVSKVKENVPSIEFLVGKFELDLADRQKNQKEYLDKVFEIGEKAPRIL